MIRDGLRGKIVKFGRGTVKITSAYIDEKGMLSLNEYSEQEIGSSCPTTETVSSVVNDSEILLEFENVKSLEVLILKLQEVRAMMKGIDTDLIDEWKKVENITTAYEANSKIDGR